MTTPLADLLGRLAHGEPATLDVLAADLGTSVDLVEMMLGDLERAGYLQPVSSACDGRCKSCPSSAGCGLAFRGRMWSVTAKGFRQAGRDVGDA